ncbi:alpha/beta hydrolase [Carnobacterium maltaromaticum]|uniref:alpha/beta hydrolase n=1 Tax=Carnobacterium maltaromaticum TaxID=2751 RepID=UPI000704E6BB|nr:alpha/beta hydrolase [Carnobacterium maltaromaticum]MBC9808628.1 alpha/beta hydrolase [Carnobacterium maltaromaticum]CRH20080.1 Thioesterase [Carnobacterium maltaromaticum]CRH21393.1 Thioesterase [Carnobacterium maltaromaticum]
MKRRYKISLIIILTLISLALIGLLVIQNKTYSPSDEALAAAKTSENVKVTRTKDALIFTPQKKTDNPAVLFYQGALVDETSYSIWAHQLAMAGYETYLIHQPFNMAVLGANKAEKIIDKYAIDSYVIGGHSLGGVMASRFAKKQTSDNLKGVFFLASYPDEKGALNATELPVLSITGSKDGVLNWESYHSSQKLLPAKTDFQVIDGGNHAGFGSYGPQKGDNKASISDKKQQSEVSELLLKWLQTIKEEVGKIPTSSFIWSTLILQSQMQHHRCHLIL